VKWIKELTNKLGIDKERLLEIFKEEMGP